MYDINNYQLTSFVYNRFRYTKSFLIERQKEIHAEIIQEMKTINSSMTPTQPSEPKKTRKSLLLGFTGNKVVSRPDKAEAEIRNYFECELTSVEQEPLDWYKQNENKMPTLSKLALKYLFIPATSASSKRLFSKAGRIYFPLRCSLSYKTGEVLIFFQDALNLTKIFHTNPAQKIWQDLIHIRQRNR